MTAFQTVYCALNAFLFPLCPGTAAYLESLPSSQSAWYVFFSGSVTISLFQVVLVDVLICRYQQILTAIELAEGEFGLPSSSLSDLQPAYPHSTM